MAITMTGRKQVKGERFARVNGSELIITTVSVKGVRREEAYYLRQIGTNVFDLTSPAGDRHFVTIGKDADCDCDGWKRGYLCRHVGSLTALRQRGKL